MAGSFFATCACRISGISPSMSPRTASRGPAIHEYSGPYLRDVVTLNQDLRNFRVFGPDETMSNGLGALLEVTPRQWQGETRPHDEALAHQRSRARFDVERASMPGLARRLSAHRATRGVQLLRGLHPHHRFDVQPARQVAEGRESPALAPADRVAQLSSRVACLAPGPQRLLAPGSGFIDHVVNKKADVVRVYLPPDANCLLSVMDHCLRSRHYVNVVIAGKHPAPQWLSMSAAEGIAPTASASGSGRATTRAANPMW